MLQSQHTHLVHSGFCLWFINNFLVLMPVLFAQSSLSSASIILDTWDHPFLCEITFPIFFHHTVLSWLLCLSLHHMGYGSFSSSHAYMQIFTTILCFPYIFIPSIIFTVLSSSLPACRDLPLDIMNRVGALGSNSSGSNPSGATYCRVTLDKLNVLSFRFSVSKMR